MAVKENKALLERFYEECFTQGHLAMVEDLVAPDYQDSSPGLPESVRAAGPDGVKALVSLLRAVFPDLQVQIEEMIILGNTGTVRATWSGTQQGPLLGIAPTGRRIAWGSIDIVRLRGGKVAQRYGLLDGLGVLHQLDALPPASAALGVVEQGAQAVDRVKGAVGQAVETATGTALDLLERVKATVEAREGRQHEG